MFIHFLCATITSKVGDSMKLLDKDLLEKNIDAAAQYDFSNNKVFGSAYYVFQEGNLEYEKCYGNLSLNSSAPITNTTLFRLASMTKPITVIATLILVERGLLSLDDPVSKYIPEFADIHVIHADGKDFGIPQNPPKIRHLLSHCSGIGSNSIKAAKMQPADKISTDATIKFMAGLGLDFVPGNAQTYSPVGAYDVLSKIIEIVSQTDFTDFLKKEIFTLCNMVDTTFEPNDEQQKRFVDMHQRQDGQNTVFSMPEGCMFEDYPKEHHLGGAGLASTLKDYCSFAKMLLNGGRVGDRQLVSKELFDLIGTPHIPKEIMPGNERWGFGVRVVTEDTYPYLPVGTWGWSGAYGPHFWIDHKNKIFAVFMKNSKTDGGGSNESARNFEKAVYSSLK